MSFNFLITIFWQFLFRCTINYSLFSVVIKVESVFIAYVNKDYICFVLTRLNTFKRIFSGFFRSFFPQVWLIFNLDVHCIFPVKLIYLHKIFPLKLWFQVSSKFEMFQFWKKMTNITPQITIYLLTWLLHRLFGYKLAKNVYICVRFFLNKCTKASWPHLNSRNIRQFFLSLKWNKNILT